MFVASACLLSGIYNPVLASYTYNRLGPAIPQTDPACAGMKLDADADVDQSDFGIFQVCYSGAEPATPECTGAGGGLPSSGTFVMHGRPVDVLPDGHTLLFVRARFYDLKHGRWLQREPLGNVAGPNLYEAFASNPEAVLDPMGTEPELRYEGSLKWEDGGAGVARIRVYNDGGYWGRSRNILVFDVPVKEDIRGRGEARTRAWVVLGSREYLVNISALRGWLEGLDEAHRAPVIGDPSSEFLAERLGESFMGTFGDRIYGILDITTGRYLPGYDPNDPANIVQSASEVRQGVRQAAAMGESGMRAVMYGFLFAAGGEALHGGLRIVQQGRGMATAAGGTPATPPSARGGGPAAPLKQPGGSGVARQETRFISGVRVVDQRTGRVLEGMVDLKPTLDRIRAGGTFPHPRDGTIFENRPPVPGGQPLLPSKPYGYYREYVHPTPGVSGPGPQRIVTGQGGEFYHNFPRSE